MNDKTDPTQTGLAIYYNEWRDFDVNGVRGCFEPIPDRDFRKVEVGDVLWKQCEPNVGSAGKVYGYQRIAVTGVHKTDRRVQVDHRDGMSTLSPDGFYRLSNADELAALVRRHGDKITHRSAWHF